MCRIPAGRNNMVLYDLHTHSTASDGTLSPAELIREAAEKGLSAIALTDHDTTQGCAEAAAEAEKLGIRFIPGVEISAAEYDELHILGLGIDPGDEVLNTELKKSVNSRRDRVYGICEVLKGMGVDIDPEKIIASAGGSPGKPHIAAAIEEAGYAEPGTGYDKYMNLPEVKAVKRYKLGYEKAADLIHNAGGLVILAHPFKAKLTDTDLETFIRGFDGLDGLEAFYSDHSLAETGKLIRLAEKYDLLISCGSDYHGTAKKGVFLGTGKPDNLLKCREPFAVDPMRLVLTALE